MISIEVEKLLKDMNTRGLLDNTKPYSSDNSVSWHAYRRAENWNNVDDFKPLLNYVQNDNLTLEAKEHVYTILFALVYNVPKLSISGIIDSLQNVTELKLLKNAIFHFIKYNTFFEYKAKGLPITNENDVAFIISLLKYDNKYLRNDILQVLGFCKTKKNVIEEKLLERLEQYKRTSELEAIVNTLENNASQKSVDPLKKIIVKYPNTEILKPALAIIVKLDGKNQQEFLKEQLKRQHKDYTKKEIQKHLS
jgi:hypothetical protein